MIFKSKKKKKIKNLFLNKILFLHFEGALIDAVEYEEDELSAATSGKMTMHRVKGKFRTFKKQMQMKKEELQVEQAANSSSPGRSFYREKGELCLYRDVAARLAPSIESVLNSLLRLHLVDWLGGAARSERACGGWGRARQLCAAHALRGRSHVPNARDGAHASVDRGAHRRGRATQHDRQQRHHCEAHGAPQPGPSAAAKKGARRGRRRGCSARRQHRRRRRRRRRRHAASQ